MFHLLLQGLTVALLSKHKSFQKSFLCLNSHWFLDQKRIFLIFIDQGIQRFQENKPGSKGGGYDIFHLDFNHVESIRSIPKLKIWKVPIMYISVARTHRTSNKDLSDFTQTAVEASEYTSNCGEEFTADFKVCAKWITPPFQRTHMLTGSFSLRWYLKHICLPVYPQARKCYLKKCSCHKKLYFSRMYKYMCTYIWCENSTNLV